MNIPTHPFRSGQPLSRTLAVDLFRTAIAVGEYRFARQACLAWLAAYPGDLPVSRLYARALLAEQRGKQTGARNEQSLQQALALLEDVCAADPEDLEANELLLASRKAAEQPVEEVWGHIAALGGKLPSQSKLATWSLPVRRSRQALAHGDRELAERMVHQALPKNPTSPLAAVTHLLVESQKDLPPVAVRSLAQAYHDRWPACLQFTLILADACMDVGESDRGVELLHLAVARDVTGQAAVRLWGEKHNYTALWPENLSAALPEDLVIPSAVLIAMGWNQLPAGEPLKIDPESLTHPIQVDEQTSTSTATTGETCDCQEQTPKPGEAKTAPEPLNAGRSHQKPKRTKTEIPTAPVDELQSELDELASRLKQPQLSRADGRFPVYVVFTTRQGLEKQYGPNSISMIDEAMLSVASAVHSRQWDSLLYYADDQRSASAFELAPARFGDAWSLKLALSDLDAALARKGEMIGAVLIVGGPEVVPFHNLPNPVDDADTEIPSDNPYSTRDENYFIPEWMVGRLPGGAGSDPSLLIDSLNQIAASHEEAAKTAAWYQRWWEKIIAWLSPRPKRGRFSFGYTAAVWEPASLSVFRPIGEARSMLVSPPVQACERRAGHVSHVPGAPEGSQCLFLQPARLGYFNLHGLPDSPEWYGQSDPAKNPGGVDYPVAMRPEDVDNSYQKVSRLMVPQVVFSEACYGAHILAKMVDESICLKLLCAGTQAFVGCTGTAYGSIASPLAAADLLGYAFWKHLGEGYSAGEALRRAKIALAREMHRRQGYLDGEDQKTLISFVLYGDPLAQTVRYTNGAKAVFRAAQPPAQVKMVCDRVEEQPQPQPVPAEVVAYVKHIVEDYLPGMEDAHYTMTEEHAGCDGAGHRCPTSLAGAKARPFRELHRQVVLLSKQVQKEGYIHHHYARLTLDADGKLVKLAVSR